MAEGILQHKVNTEGLDVEIDSCGTGGWHVGEPPDRRAESKMSSKGIDISMLRARQFSISDFDRFDLIYAMDESNYADIMDLAPEGAREKVRMILNESNPNMDQSVPDPYYGGDDGFETVYQLLDEACNHIVDRIKNG